MEQNTQEKIEKGRENEPSGVKSMDVIYFLNIARNATQAYTVLCSPLLDALEMPQVAFNILMYLGNHRDRATAKDVCKYRKIKANLVSLYVDKLVNAGYLRREPITTDRRQVRLLLTDKALPILEEGRQIQSRFSAILAKGMTEEEKACFITCLEKLNRNAVEVIED